MLVPVATRADRGAVDELITSVVTAKADREIAANPASLAEYGLDSPAADVTLTAEGRQAPRPPARGQESHRGVGVRARGWASPRCWPCRTAFCATPPVRSPTIATRRCWPSTGAPSPASTVAAPDETLGLESADGKWTLTRPLRRPADSGCRERLPGEAGGGARQGVRGRESRVARGLRSRSPRARRHPHRPRQGAGDEDPARRPGGPGQAGRVRHASRGVQRAAPARGGGEGHPEDRGRPARQDGAALRSATRSPRSRSTDPGGR